MAVRIRLKKLGRRHRPFYRICAMDSRTPRDGRVIEELGTYDPMVPETDARAVLNAERIDYWLGVGAKPTPKVGVLIRKYGSDGSHLAAQQQALERLTVRRGMAIEKARQAATAAAETAAKTAAAAEAATAAAETPAADTESADTAAPADATAPDEATEAPQGAGASEAAEADKPTDAATSGDG